jgi:hypothetical protein
MVSHAMPRPKKDAGTTRIGDKLVYEEWIKQGKQNRKTYLVLQADDKNAYPTRKQVADAVSPPC